MTTLCPAIQHTTTSPTTCLRHVWCGLVNYRDVVDDLAEIVNLCFESPVLLTAAIEEALVVRDVSLGHDEAMVQVVLSGPYSDVTG